MYTRPTLVTQVKFFNTIARASNSNARFFVSQVKVISGDDRDNTGTLINIDDRDGIVKMDRTEQLKILPLKDLGKLSAVKV